MKKISEMYRISGGTDYAHLCNECWNLRKEKKKYICRLHRQAGGTGDWKPQFIACKFFNRTLPGKYKNELHGREQEKERLESELTGEQMELKDFMEM